LTVSGAESSVAEPGDYALRHRLHKGCTRSSVEYGGVHQGRRKGPGLTANPTELRDFATRISGIRLASASAVTRDHDFPRKGPVQRVKTVSAVLLLASMVGFQPAPVQALDGDHRDRFEDRKDDHEGKKHKKEKKDHGKARVAYWDAARYYKHDDRHYRARRLGRNDWIYRGSDDRYYCRRDDGTTGLIIGGISGAVLGHIIAPGGAKTLGTIVGAGTGALIGRAIDEGDVVCH